MDKANVLDAGWDLRATKDCVISSAQVTKVRTGVMADIPQGHVGLVMERSSLGAKGIAVRGGVIDAGYTGEIVVLLHHAIPGGWHEICAGDKVAQLVVLPLSAYAPNAVSGRYDQGFGSSGR